MLRSDPFQQTSYAIQRITLTASIVTFKRINGTYSYVLDHMLDHNDVTVSLTFHLFGVCLSAKKHDT